LRTPGLKESIRLGSTAILMQIGDLWKGGDEILKLFLKHFLTDLNHGGFPLAV